MSKSKVLVRIHQMLVASAEIQRPISLMMNQSLFMLVEMKIAMHQNQMLSSFPMKSGLNVPNNRKRRLRRNLLIQNTKLKWWALWQYSILTFIYVLFFSHLNSIEILLIQMHDRKNRFEYLLQQTEIYSHFLQSGLLSSERNSGSPPTSPHHRERLTSDAK